MATTSGIYEQILVAFLIVRSSYESNVKIKLEKKFIKFNVM